MVEDIVDTYKKGLRQCAKLHICVGIVIVPEGGVTPTGQCTCTNIKFYCNTVLTCDMEGEVTPTGQCSYQLVLYYCTCM